MIKRYKKKPIVIEALKWTGNNTSEMEAFCPTAELIGSRLKENEWGIGVTATTLCIPTLEGDHMASEGDYIIKGVKGEFYPCKEDIFFMTYEEVQDASID